jgi:hypothetical protein
MGQTVFTQFEALRDVGCFRSLRARLALDGVIRVHGGLVKTAVSRGFD